jgi:hypothetical protein
MSDNFPWLFDNDKAMKRSNLFSKVVCSSTVDILGSNCGPELSSVSHCIQNTEG